MAELAFGEDGAQRFRCALSASEVQQVLHALADQPNEMAGVRLIGVAALDDIVSEMGRCSKSPRP